MNSKKSITIRSNTNYFNPETTRVYNTFQSPHAYQSRKQKIEGYETRLYWQFRYCEEHQGQTFFYTLTYNDRHVPRFYDMNCFDYEDLRDLLTGGFRKKLLRQYGTTFKYFIGAELGDGKGTRGIANNPHYHILFFMVPANNPRYPYKVISGEDFRHLVREYWQGHDEDTDGWKDYRTFRYGICKEGENLGRVTDFRACMYCAKYVTKDVRLVRSEIRFRKLLTDDFFELYNGSDETYKDFYRDYIVPEYEEIAMDEVAPWEDGFDECPYPIDGTGFKVRYHSVLDVDVPVEDIKSYITRLQLEGEYLHFVRGWIVPKVNEKLKEFRNRYSNKCRISNGVGNYAFERPEYDVMSGTIPVPCKKGFKERPINMYYYRKLFTDTHIDEEGSVRYILNENGVNYKMSRLDKSLQKLQDKAQSYINILLSKPDVYRTMIMSDVNEKVFSPYSEFLDYWNYLLLENNEEEILRRYAEYKFIYENRFFADNYDGSSHVHHFPPIDYRCDYRRFISTVCYVRAPYNLSSFFEDDCQGYVSFQSHPYFLRYIGIFDVLDLCADYFYIQEDNKQQKEAEDRAAIKRFHDREKLDEFYRRFEC